MMFYGCATFTERFYRTQKDFLTFPSLEGAERYSALEFEKSDIKMTCIYEIDVSFGNPVFRRFKKQIKCENGTIEYGGWLTD